MQLGNSQAIRILRGGFMPDSVWFLAQFPQLSKALEARMEARIEKDLSMQQDVTLNSGYQAVSRVHHIWLTHLAK